MKDCWSEKLKDEIKHEIQQEIKQDLVENPQDNLVIIDVEKPQLISNSEEYQKKIIREKAIEKGKLKKQEQINNRINQYQTQTQTQAQTQTQNIYIEDNQNIQMSQKQPKLCSECQNICPKCHKKKKASQIIPQYEEYPYYETQEQAQEEEAQVQYEEPQYNEELAYEQEMQTQEQEQEQEQVQEQEEPYYDQDIQYQYEEEQNTYSQPQYQSKTYQPRYYTLEERKALLQMARPMFTVITYQNMDNNALGTNYYSKNTEPVKRGNNYDINNDINNINSNYNNALSFDK